MKAFAVVAVLLVAYARADVTDLTDTQLEALSADQFKAITQEQWGIIFSRRCNPIFASYAKSQYLADITNCHYYYECVGFKAVRMECSSNLHWNTKLNTCDYPYRAGCRYGIASAPIQSQPSQQVPVVQPANPIVQPANPIVQPANPIVQPANPITGAGSGSAVSGSHNDNGAIEIPIEGDENVIDPYKQ